MLSCPSCGSDVVPIITVGETMPGGYRFESIPDGVSLQARGRTGASTSSSTTRRRPSHSRTPRAAPTATNSQNDFLNSQVSLLALNQHSKGVLSGRLRDRLERELPALLLELPRDGKGGLRPRRSSSRTRKVRTGCNRSGTAWDKPIAAGTPGAEQIGVVVANDPKTGKHKTIYGMGRHNHENDVAIPGFDDLVVLSGDDTFFTTTGDDHSRSAEPHVRHTGVVAGLQLHRAPTRTRSGPTRAISGRSFPTARRTRTTTTSPRATRPRFSGDVRQRRPS